jgi:hypothetical protein
MTATATVLTPAQVGGIKRSKKFAALVTNGFTEAEALSLLGVPAQPADPAAEKVAALVATGSFTEAEARSIVEAQFFTPTATATAVKPEPVTSKTLADNLVAQAGLAHTKGRVYVTGSILEAAARVLKTGTPEIIATSGVGRTKAVVIFREDSGDVALQNLFQP